MYILIDRVPMKVRHAHPNFKALLDVAWIECPDSYHIFGMENTTEFNDFTDMELGLLCLSLVGDYNHSLSRNQIMEVIHEALRKLPQSDIDAHEADLQARYAVTQMQGPGVYVKGAELPSEVPDLFANQGTGPAESHETELRTACTSDDQHAGNTQGAPAAEPRVSELTIKPPFKLVDSCTYVNSLLHYPSVHAIVNSNFKPIRSDRTMPKDVNAYKNTMIEAEGAVESCRDALAALEKAPEKDATAIKAKKGDLRLAEANHKKAVKALEKVEADNAKEEAKAKRDAEREDAKKAKEAAKAAKQQEKEAKAKEREAAREANKMPEQNGVRKPKASDKGTGRIWEIADNLSAQLKQPVPIATLLEVCVKEGLNDSTTKTTYARWRKFHGVTGRVTVPAPEVAESAV